MGHIDELLVNKIEASGIKAPATGMVATAGTDIADNATALAMDSTYLNKVTFSALDGAAKTVTLPTFSNVGECVIIVQKVSLVGSGVLTVDCAGSQSFDTGSYAFWADGSDVATVDVATIGETKIVLTGEASNTGTGAGTYAKFTYLGSDKILCQVHGNRLGTGGGTMAFEA